jgi:hypothetical protein
MIEMLPEWKPEVDAGLSGAYALLRLIFYWEGRIMRRVYSCIKNSLVSMHLSPGNGSVCLVVARTKDLHIGRNFLDRD